MKLTYQRERMSCSIAYEEQEPYYFFIATDTDTDYSEGSLFLMNSKGKTKNLHSEISTNSSAMMYRILYLRFSLIQAYMFLG